MKEEQGKLAYEWWKKMTPLIRKFVRETVLYGFDKDDLEQECYIQLQKALEKYDKHLGVPFESYYKITLHGWRANQNKKNREHAWDEEKMETCIDERVQIEKQVEDKLLWEKALGELGKLTEKEEYIIRRYYLEGNSLKDIASDLGVKYKWVEFKKGAIIKHLRKKLLKER